MRTIKPIKSRLRELQESKAYRENFESLKRQILSLKLTSKEDGWKLPTFLKAEFEKDDFRFRDWSHIKLTEAQRIFRHENVNKHWLRIPDDYSGFKREWGVEYFFDSKKSIPKNFNPCYDASPPIQVIVSSEIAFEPFKTTLMVDLRYPGTILKKIFGKKIDKFQGALNLKGRFSRYSKEEESQIKAMCKQGLKVIEILRTIKPELSHFNPMRDYVLNLEDQRTLKDYDGWKEYQSLNRFIKQIERTS